jgi:hypothetical protein
MAVFFLDHWLCPKKYNVSLNQADRFVLDDHIVVE